jgi:hypothetical protein
MLALDFFTADLLNGTKVYVLAAIEHGTRRIRILGATEHPIQSLTWNQRHLMTVLRENEDFYNTHRPHRTLNHAAPLRPLPHDVTDLDHIRGRRRDRVGGAIHEYRLVA